MEPEKIGKNVEKLMLNNNITIEELSNKLQIEPQELTNKIQGKQEFCVTDVLSITQVFNLSNEQVKQIFF